MKRTFLNLVLDTCHSITQAGIAKRMGWSPQRVGYLCDDRQEPGFPFKQLWKLKENLEIPDDVILRILIDYFTQEPAI